MLSKPENGDIIVYEEQGEPAKLAMIMRVFPHGMVQIMPLQERMGEIISVEESNLRNPKLKDLLELIPPRIDNNA